MNRSSDETKAMFVLGENHFRKYFSVNVGVWLYMENSIFGNVFQLTVCWDVKWFPFLFYLQISFSGKQRESWVRVRSRPRAEREREEEERGREHTPPAREIAPRERSNPEPRALRLRLRIAPFDFAVRLQIAPRSHPLTSSANPEPFDFVVRLRLRIAPRLHPSTSPANPEPRSRLRLCRDRTPGLHRDGTDRTDHTEIAIEKLLGFDEFDWIWPDLMNFFWLGFVSVFIYWEMVLYICLEAKKMWGTRRKCVFYIIFSNTTKH